MSCLFETPAKELTQEIISLRKKQRRTTACGGWTGYSQQPCGFMMKASNNTHSDIKVRLHLKKCDICRNRPIKNKYEVAGSYSNPDVYKHFTQVLN